MAGGEIEIPGYMEFEVAADDEERIITPEILSKAIRYAIGLDKIDEEQAKIMAYHIMNFFGFNDEIIDNILEPPDRDLMYTMEDYGLMGTEREETTLWDGREWRINYWRFRKDRIFYYVDNPQQEKENDEENIYEDIYNSIPDDVWAMRE